MMKKLPSLFKHAKPIALIILVLVLILTIYHNYFQRGNMEQFQKDFPVIGLTLGDSFEQVRSQSNYHFKVRSLLESDLIVVKKPFIFKYTSKEYSFSLPPGLFLGISIDLEHVTSIDVSPHLEYINLEDMLTLLRTLQQLFEQSGWQVSYIYNSLEEVRAQFTDTKEDILGFQEWQNSQGDEIYIELERTWEADDVLPKLLGKPEDLFLVRVVIYNKGVSKKYIFLEDTGD
ncbi:MAG: hypothetical protein HC877_04245 [Thioploca sp.]|nr:hypothetical protein [Thioploca sp.]